METASGSSDGNSLQRSLRVRECAGLVVVWSRDEPERIGEVLLPDPELEPRDGWVFGRGREGGVRLPLVRQRPGVNLESEPLHSANISREQLRIRCGPAGSLTIENIGRRKLLLDGRVVTRPVHVRDGAVLELRGCLLLLVAQRPVELPAIELPPELMPAFGRADQFGVVGESPPAWALRGRLWFAAQRDVHVLVSGPSGVGKELIAQAIHALSARGRRALVSRNAATLPDSLIDAELFGNIRDYPNPGMPARAGLIGAADRSSLFLDEIGELSHELQAHLLRVLDRGEYQQLGDARSQRADLRLIVATNRNLAELKHDFAARFRLRIEVPGLDERREDIPLLIAALLRRLAVSEAALVRRLFSDADPERGWPRLEPNLIRRLLGHRYTTHVRELDSLLWTAVMHTVVGDGDTLRLESTDAEPAPDVDPATLSVDEIRRALDSADGVVERAWRLLGLRNRYQLIRLIKKHGLAR